MCIFSDIECKHRLPQASEGCEGRTKAMGGMGKPRQDTLLWRSQWGRCAQCIYQCGRQWVLTTILHWWWCCRGSCTALHAETFFFCPWAGWCKDSLSEGQIKHFIFNIHTYILYSNYCCIVLPMDQKQTLNTSFLLVFHGIFPAQKHSPHRTIMFTN